MKLLLTSYAAHVIEKAVPLFPKKPRDCKIICITTASKTDDGPKEWLTIELDAFKKSGFDLTMMDIDGMEENAVAGMMEDADIIYGTGGNTFFLLEKMRACNFEKHLRKALDRGALYIGSSATSIVCCPDIDYVRELDYPSKAQLEDTTGMGLVKFYVMVHMNQPYFSEKFAKKLQEMKKGNLPVFCLNDDQALFIDENSITLI